MSFALIAAFLTIFPPALPGTEADLLTRPVRARTWLTPRRPADGLLRYRLTYTRGLRVTLFARGRTRRGRLQEGVGLRIEGRRARVVGVRRGRVTEGPWTRIRRSRGLETLEITLAVFGEHLVASLYDAATGRRVGHVAASGLPVGEGGAGVTGRGSAALVGLSGRPACDGVAADAGEGPVLVALLDGPPPDGARGQAVEAPPGVVAWRTDAVGLELLHCAGVAPREVQSDLPWKWVDAERLYPDSHGVVAALAELAAAHPANSRMERIGRSHQGRPIVALAVGRELATEERRPSLLLNAAHHGDEPLSTAIVLDAARALLHPTTPEGRRRLEELVVYLVPLVNPDGSHAFFEESTRVGRKNGADLDGDGRRGPAEGVDLNRNYPFHWGAQGERASRSEPRSMYYRGPAAGSEPETRAMIALADRERFAASLSYHTGAVALLAPYTNRARNPEPNEAWAVAEEVVGRTPLHPQDREMTVIRNLYPVDGTDQDWHRHAHGTVALLAESGLWTPVKPEARKAALDAMRHTWQALADRLLDGPSVGGYVTDADGRPVHAEVRIEEQRLRAGERWTTRCRDGRYDRLLPREGAYTVVVKAPGHPTIRRAVTVQGAARLDVQLPVAARRKARCR